MKIITFFSLCIFLSNCWAINKSVFGIDNRYEVIEYHDQIIQEMAKSTLSMIENSKIQDLMSGNRLAPLSEAGVVIFPRTGLAFPQRVTPCDYVKYYNQPTLATCSGFIVGPDILVTAGHCIQNDEDCKKYQWVRNYSYNKNGNIQIQASDIFSCQQIIETKNILPSPIYSKEYYDYMEERRMYGPIPYDPPAPIGYDYTSTTDFALIKLNRKITDVTPLKIRKKGKIAIGDKLFVIGNPLGLPTKITDNAQLLSYKSQGLFFSNIDCFKGNSGSVVINLKEKIVEGILVSSGQSFEKDTKNNCYYIHEYDINDIKNELYLTGVTPINEIFTHWFK